MSPFTARCQFPPYPRRKKKKGKKKGDVGQRTSHHKHPRDRSLPAQPISIRKAEWRKKAHKPLRPSRISHNCPPCLIIIQSCYFDYKINKPFAYSLHDLRFMLYSLNLDVLRAQRIIGYFNLNYPQINGGGKSDHVDVLDETWRDVYMGKNDLVMTSE